MRGIRRALRHRAGHRQIFRRPRAVGCAHRSGGLRRAHRALRDVAGWPVQPPCRRGGSFPNRRHPRVGAIPYGVGGAGRGRTGRSGRYSRGNRADAGRVVGVPETPDGAPRSGRGELSLPDDPGILGFTASCILPVENPVKQELLELLDPAERLRRAEALLSDANRLLHRRPASAPRVFDRIEVPRFTKFRCRN